MTESVGIRALQQHASAVVARAADGEVIVVTDRGRAVARLVPLTRGRLAALVDAGLARRARRSVVDLESPLAAEPGSRSLGELLADARADER